MKDRFRLLRQKLGLSQKEMAEGLGVPSTTISKYERGEVKPAADILAKIANTYGVNLNWLLTGLGDMFIKTEAENSFLEVMKKHNLGNEEAPLILEELLNSPATKEVVLKLLKAKRGNKEALTDVQKMIRGLEMAFE